MSGGYTGSEHQLFVDALRDCLGLSPLYSSDKPADYRAEFDGLFGYTDNQAEAGTTVRARVARRMPIG